MDYKHVSPYKTLKILYFLKYRLGDWRDGSVSDEEYLWLLQRTIVQIPAPYWMGHNHLWP